MPHPEKEHRYYGAYGAIFDKRTDKIIKFYQSYNKAVAALNIYKRTRSVARENWIVRKIIVIDYDEIEMENV